MNQWYETLQRPRLTPPDWLFSPVWTILYVMIAVSIFLFIRRYKREKDYWIYMLTVLHLAFNFAWTGLFFGLRSPGLALIDILLLDISLVLMIRYFWQSNVVSSILLWPYLVWVLFATYLNTAFYILNR